MSNAAWAYQILGSQDSDGNTTLTASGTVYAEDEVAARAQVRAKHGRDPSVIVAVGFNPTDKELEDMWKDTPAPSQSSQKTTGGGAYG